MLRKSDVDTEIFFIFWSFLIHLLYLIYLFIYLFIYFYTNIWKSWKTWSTHYFLMRMSQLWTIYNFLSIDRCFRSSHQRCSLRKSVLRNFTKFTQKHLCQSLFFNNVAGPRPRVLLWLFFRVNFVKFLTATFL